MERPLFPVFIVTTCQTFIEPFAISLIVVRMVHIIVNDKQRKRITRRYGEDTVEYGRNNNKVNIALVANFLYFFWRSATFAGAKRKILVYNNFFGFSDVILYLAYRNLIEVSVVPD